MDDIFSLFDTFSVTIVPETEPTCSMSSKNLTSVQVGDKISTSFSLGEEVAPDPENGGVPFPKNNVNVSVQITVNSVSDDGTSSSVTGVFTKFRPFFNVAPATIITPCRAFVDAADFDVFEKTSDLKETAQIIYAETLTDVIDGFAALSKIKIDFAGGGSIHLPVVSEADPVVILNGSYAEQLTALLARFSPTTLWGQKVTWSVMPFDYSKADIHTNEEGEHVSILLDSVHSGVVISFPSSDDVAQLPQLSLSQAQAFDYQHQRTLLKVPKKIFIQEDITAAYRHVDHVKDGAKRTIPISQRTEHAFDEAEGSSISASVVGSKVVQGGLVYDENTVMTVDQVESVTLNYSTYSPSFFAPTGNGNVTTTVLVGTSSQITTTINNSYLIGPPYKVIVGSDELLTKKKAAETHSSFFKCGSIGAKRTLAMENTGECEVEFLCSSDGALLRERKTRTKEISTVLAGYVVGVGSNAVTSDGGEKVKITETSESFSYDEETGRLILDRVQTTVIEDSGATSVENTVRFYSPLTNDLIAEFVCSSKSQYDENGVQVDDTDTAISVSVHDGAGNTAIDTKSSFGAALEHVTVRGPSSLTGIEQEGGQDIRGAVYISLPCLLLEEMQAFISTHFVTNAAMTEQVSFSSHVLHPFDLVGALVSISSGEIYTDVEHKYGTSLSRGVRSGYSVSAGARLVTGVMFTMNTEGIFTTTVSTCGFVS